MAIGIFRPNRGKPLEQRIRDIEQHLANLTLDPETVAQLLAGSGGSFGGGGGGGSSVRFPIAESKVKFDPTAGHNHDGTDAGGRKIAHTNLDTSNGSALLDGTRHSDTGADAVVLGDLIIGDTGPLWRRLAIGTTNWVLKVVGGKPAWGQVAHSELTGVGTDDHHDQAHSLTGSDHTVSTTSGHILVGTGSNSFAMEAPGTRVILADVAANRPLGGVDGRLFFALDDKILYRDNGLTWEKLADAVGHTHTLGGDLSGTPESATVVALQGVPFPEPAAGNDGELVTYNHTTGEFEYTAASGSAGTVVVQEGDSTIDAAASTLDFAAGDFNVTSSPAGEANIAWQGFGVEEGNSSVATDVKTLDFGSGFDVSASGGEAEIALDLSEVVTGDVSFTGNASTVARIQGKDVDTPTASEDLKGAVYNGATGDIEWMGRDFVLTGWSRADISVVGTTDGRMPRIGGSSGSDVQAPFVPHKAGYLTGISVGYSGNVDTGSDSHTVTVYKNGVATAILQATSGANAKGYTDFLAAGTPVAFAAGDEIVIYDKRTGAISAVGCHVHLFGVWTA